LGFFASGLRISPAGSDARKTAQVRILAAQPNFKIAVIARHRNVIAGIGEGLKPITAMSSILHVIAEIDSTWTDDGDPAR
jgi:hypothetical protein